MEAQSRLKGSAPRLRTANMSDWEATTFQRGKPGRFAPTSIPLPSDKSYSRAHANTRLPLAPQEFEESHCNEGERFHDFSRRRFNRQMVIRLDPTPKQPDPTAGVIRLSIESSRGIEQLAWRNGQRRRVHYLAVCKQVERGSWSN